MKRVLKNFKQRIITPTNIIRIKMIFNSILIKVLISKLVNKKFEELFLLLSNIKTEFSKNTPLDWSQQIIQQIILQTTPTKKQKLYFVKNVCVKNLETHREIIG